MREKAQNEIEEILKDIVGNTAPYVTHYTYEEAADSEFDHSVITKLEVYGKTNKITDRIEEELYEIERVSEQDESSYILVKITDAVSQKFNPSGQIGE